MPSVGHTLALKGRNSLSHLLAIWYAGKRFGDTKYSSYICGSKRERESKKVSIMDLNQIKERLEGCDSMARSIGMRLISTPDPQSCTASMTVDGSNCQPMGYLSGGASVALAEMLAGCGSYALRPDAKACVGQNIHASHLHAARIGETVTAVAHIVHQGKTSHVWHVDISSDSDGRLISTVSVTNCIIV